MKYNIKLKNEKDIQILRESGKRLARVLDAVSKEVRPGVTTKYLNDFVYKMITEMGDKPAFLNYQPFGASYPYPGSICISVNEEVVHGIGSEEKILEEGDIVGLDGGVNHKAKNYFVLPKKHLWPGSEQQLQGITLTIFQKQSKRQFLRNMAL